MYMVCVSIQLQLLLSSIVYPRHPPQKHNGNDTILVAEYGLRPLETPRVEQEEVRMADDKTSKQTRPEVKDGPRHGYYPPTLHTTE